MLWAYSGLNPSSLQQVGRAGQVSFTNEAGGFVASAAHVPADLPRPARGPQQQYARSGHTHACAAGESSCCPPFVTPVSVPAAEQRESDPPYRTATVKWSATSS